MAIAVLALVACASNRPAAPPPPDSARAAALLVTVEERTFDYSCDLGRHPDPG